ncbi:MAG TPA: DUF4296 domain-containing protein [Chitinophagaceae bacterium]|nr:DUF4296 domain-containing protein [Chitinophagaceae bacterium]
MMRSFLIGMVFFLMQACSNKDELPEGVLPKQKMREIMWDMIRAGEFLQAYVLPKDSTMDKVAEHQKWHDKIYEIHKTNKAAFEKSYTYYKAHPYLMKEMLDTLARRQITGRPTGPFNMPSKDSAIIKKDTIRVKDSTRRSVDSLLRKRIIKKKKPINPV